MADLFTNIPPGLIMVLLAMPIAFVPHHYRQFCLLSVIAISAFSMTAGSGVHWEVEVSGFNLILNKADHLTLPFSIVFHIAAALNVIYGWHEPKPLEHCSGLAYAGAAIAAIHAGDLFSLFIWWELTAVTSVFLILTSGSLQSKQSAMRYLIIQVLSGMFLLSGAALLFQDNGSLAFERMSLDSIGAWLVFIAFGIKAAFPLLNGWLQDSYPESTVIGTVVLSAFTTKLAIYALARGFPGTDILIVIGCIMTMFPVFFCGY